MSGEQLIAQGIVTSVMPTLGNPTLVQLCFRQSVQEPPCLPSLSQEVLAPLILVPI